MQNINSNLITIILSHIYQYEDLVNFLKIYDNLIDWKQVFYYVFHSKVRTNIIEYKYKDLYLGFFIIKDINNIKSYIYSNF